MDCTRKHPCYYFDERHHKKVGQTTFCMCWFESFWHMSWLPKTFVLLGWLPATSFLVNYTMYSRTKNNKTKNCRRCKKNPNIWYKVHQCYIARLKCDAHVLFTLHIHLIWFIHWFCQVHKTPIHMMPEQHNHVQYCMLTNLKTNIFFLSIIYILCANRL